MDLPTLEVRREKGDLIKMYRVSKGIEKKDRNYLSIWDHSDTRVNYKKTKIDLPTQEAAKGTGFPVEPQRYGVVMKM